MSGPTIDAVIERIPRFRGREVTTVELSGGHINRVFLVQADDTKYVVRILASTSGLLVQDRANELHNARAAAAAGVSPHVLDYLDAGSVMADGSVMVVEYVDGAVLTNTTLGTLEQIPRVATTLHRLHDGPRFRADFDMFATIQRWLCAASERGISLPDGFMERMGLLRQVAEALAARPIASVPCHNDLISENFIDDGRRLWLIDFEYSGNNDPCYDIADVANESSLDDDWRARLCEAYFGVADPVLIDRMRLHTLVADVGWALWAAIQRDVSPLELDFAGIEKAYWDPAVALLDSDDLTSLVWAVSRARAR